MLVILHRLIVGVLGLTLAAAAHAQSYPSRPVTIVVPYAPGGVADRVARIFALKLTDQLGKSVLVENKPGAGGNIGTDQVARSAPDGHTLLLLTDANTIAPALYSKLNFDLFKDFYPVTLLTVGSHIIAVHPSLSANNLKELIQYGQQHPGEPYASPGNGTAQHLGMELLKVKAKVDFKQVPYKGGGQAITDLVGGQVKIGILGLAPVLPFIKSHRLKAIAVTGDKRTPLLPDVPTVAEAGVPDFSTLQWYGVAAPAGTPEAVISVLQSELSKAAADPTVVAQLGQIGLEVRLSPTSNEFVHFLKADAAKWPMIVKAAGARID